MKEQSRTEVIQDAVAKDKIRIAVVTVLNDQQSTSTSIRIDKKQIRTLINQLKAWR